MKKIVWLLIPTLIFCVGFIYFVDLDSITKPSKPEQQIMSQKWTENDYKKLITGESVNANKPYTSNQVSMYLHIVHDHWKPETRTMVRKGDIAETTAVWKNLDGYPNGKVTLVFEGLHDESMVLKQKKSSVWAP